MDKHILLVEDEADIRDAMAEAIIDAGFKVSTAQNGEVGLKMALEQKPDLVLLDIRMPVMGGQEMLQKMRQDPWGKGVKVIVMTAMDDVANVTVAHQSDIDDYLIKTHTSLDELLQKIRLALYE
jgi:DNA-binding response OmpR family regulator